MSRSNSRGCHLGRLAAGLLLVLGSIAQSAGALADETPELGIGAQVKDVVAPILDIQLVESDLQRQARVEQLPTRTTITLDSTVLFAKDSAKINASARKRLTEVGRLLRRRGPGSVRVTGYTDDLGSAAHGVTLSRQRAKAVAGRLRPHLPAGAFPFSVVGKGENDPAVPNTSEANRRVNRRVVVVYQQR